MQKVQQPLLLPCQLPVFPSCVQMRSVLLSRPRLLSESPHFPQKAICWGCPVSPGSNSHFTLLALPLLLLLPPLDRVSLCSPGLELAMRTRLAWNSQRFPRLCFHSSAGPEVVHHTGSQSFLKQSRLMYPASSHAARACHQRPHTSPPQTHSGTPPH